MAKLSKDPTTYFGTSIPSSQRAAAEAILAANGWVDRLSPPADDHGLFDHKDGRAGIVFWGPG